MAKCLHPFSLPGVGVVPCGRCPNCRSNKRQSWIYRLECEARQYPLSLFVTLTYDDEHLPMERIGSDLFAQEVPVVSKRDVQLFMKRLRRKYEDYKIRFFLTSEYGTENGRPHYHMILFGFPFTGKKAGDLLAECWQQGFVQAHPLTQREISYTCKYMYEKSAIPFVLQDVKSAKPFMMCSRRPGIGYVWLSEYILDFYRKHPRSYVMSAHGLKQAMPRYFAEKLYDDDMKEFLKEFRSTFYADLQVKGYNEFINMDARTRFLHDRMIIEMKEEYEKRANARLKSKK